MQSVIEITDDVRSGRRTSRQAVEAALEAITGKDGDILAFANVADRDTMLAAAERAIGPLAGVAVGVKDIFDTRDLVTAYGSPIFADYRPRADAALVSMIRQAGAVIAGKTVTTELAFLHPATTRNPINLAHTPGGSSSGSAAAIAAGMIPAAIGTQTGGSIIRPASYCGIAGYKPSFGMLPTVGAKAFSWSLDTPGFFAASVADVARFAAGVTKIALETPTSPAPPRIGIYRSGVWNEADSAMQAAIGKAAALAANAGATVVEIAEPEAVAAGRNSHRTVQNFEAGLALADEFLHHGNELSEILRTTLAEGRDISPDVYRAAKATARLARIAASDLFADVDVLLTPSATGAAPKGLSSTGNPIFNKVWTLTGSPCINVPGLSDSLGLPLGVQIVGRFGADRAALAAAMWLETVLKRS